jgi:hypothetical protein
MIYVQTPRVVPSRESLASHGEVQRTWKDHDGDWLDLSYLHDNATWFQRYCVRDLDGLNVVIASQCERNAFDETMDCHARVVSRIMRDV